MTNIEDRVRAIVIPSGNKEQDITRAERAIRFNQETGLNVPYIISGIGPDTNIVLFGNGSSQSLDFHYELYDYMTKHTAGVIGIDILSRDSIGNILNTFPIGVSGRYVLVSYPLHLRRFKKIVEKAKKEGKVSVDLEVEYVPTKKFSSFKEIVYEVGSWAKRAVKSLNP